MEDLHLSRTIEMIRRRSDMGMLAYLLSTPRPHGEMASDAFDLEIEAVDRDPDMRAAYLWPIFGRLYAEAMQRGLPVVGRREVISQ